MDSDSDNDSILSNSDDIDLDTEVESISKKTICELCRGKVYRKNNKKVHLKCLKELLLRNNINQNIEYFNKRNYSDIDLIWNYEINKFYM